jgi:hypothetical protein
VAGPQILARIVEKIFWIKNDCVVGYASAIPGDFAFFGFMLLQLLQILITIHLLDVVMTQQK